MSANRRLTYALIILAIATALFLVVQFVSFEKKADEEVTEDLPEMVVLFEEAQTKEVVNLQVIDNEAGQVLNATKLEDGTWAIAEAPEGSDTNLDVDELRITTAITTLQFLTSSRTLTEIESFIAYGLDEPRYTVIFSTEDGDQYTLYVGSTNPGETSYYVRLPRSSEVHLIPSYSLETVIGLIETPPLIEPTPTEEGAEESTGEPEEPVEDESTEEPTESEDSTDG